MKTLVVHDIVCPSLINTPFECDPDTPLMVCTSSALMAALLSPVLIFTYSDEKPVLVLK
jgi:hypothetical protein